MQILSNIFTSVMMALQGEREEGQGLVEYALIIALVSIALVAALGALSGGISGVFDSIVSELSGGS